MPSDDSVQRRPYGTAILLGIISISVYIVVLPIRVWSRTILPGVEVMPFYP